MKKHVCELLVELALQKGAKDAIKLPGLFEMKIDNTWGAKMNPHDHEIESIPPYHWSLSFNGWPAGILHVMGDGVLCAGKAGNEKNLRAALKKAIKQS